MNLKKIDFVRYASIIICIVGVLFVSYIALKYVIWALLPFAISWGIAFAVRPASEYLHHKTGISKKLLNFILVFIALFILGCLIFAIVSQIVRELREFVTYLEENPYVISDSFEKAEKYMEGLREKLHFFGHYNSETGVFFGADEYIKSFVENTTSELIGGIPKILGKLFITFPKAMIFILVSVISAFYFSMDLKNINSRILSFFPLKWQERGKNIKNLLLGTAFKYLRAYLLIMLITFSLLFIGFSVLRVRYSLILSALFALIDFLPVLGVGTLLIPWGIFELIRRNYRLAIGLIVMYAVIAVVRQVSEPKIIGANFGIHPLLTLFSMYLGLSLFGFTGMILGPVAAVTVKGVFSGEKKSEKRETEKFR